MRVRIWVVLRPQGGGLTACYTQGLGFRVLGLGFRAQGLRVLGV